MRKARQKGISQPFQYDSSDSYQEMQTLPEMNNINSAAVVVYLNGGLQLSIELERTLSRNIQQLIRRHDIL